MAFDYCIGTVLPYSPGQGIDYKTPICFTTGREKLRALEALTKNLEIDWDKSRAYADAYYDLPILNKVGLPVMVCPDEKLKAHGLLKQWGLIDCPC